MEQTIQNYNNIFWNEIKNYDLTDSNLLRKAIHSFDVAKNCFSLACNMNLNEKERNLCYLIGLFHDIGRFEQWTKYKTYDDNKSVDHGELSYNILSNPTYKQVLTLSKSEYHILKESIRYHTKPYCGEDVDIIKFNNILNNSDAFANVITTANGMQQMTVSKNGVTKEILDDFNNRKFLKFYSPQTKLDRCLLLTACCYYINHIYIRNIIIESNYIGIIYETFSKYLTQQDKKIFKKALTDLETDYLNM
jgi:HD superfamily phosphohydrolase YqeK